METIGLKERFAFPENRPVPGKNYDPERTADYAADRDSVSQLLAIAATEGVSIRHIELKSAFLHKKYERPQTLCMEPMRIFEGKPQHENKIALVRKNIYGTLHAPFTYAKWM